MTWLRIEFRKHVPEVIQKLDAQLRELQGYVRTGGETTSRTVAHEVATGEKNVTYTQEARLYEEPPPALRSMRGGWKQNPDDPKKIKDIAEIYQHEPGYPNVLSIVDKGGKLQGIAAFSGHIANRELEGGQKMFRLFGPGDKTLGEPVKETYAGGGWWGLGDTPTTPERWRDPSGVLDEFNRDGYAVSTTLPEGASLKAATGKVSEQFGKDIPGQHLHGGGEQAVIDLPESTKNELSAAGQRVIKSGTPETFTDPVTGITFDIRKTPWADAEANGVIGYSEAPGASKVTTHPLGEHEVADKKYKDNAP
jgi:hypothetical protein